MTLIFHIIIIFFCVLGGGGGGGGGSVFFLSQHLGNITMQTMRFGIFHVILYKVRKKDTN